MVKRHKSGTSQMDLYTKLWLKNEIKKEEDNESPSKIFLFKIILLQCMLKEKNREDRVHSTIGGEGWG